MQQLTPLDSYFYHAETPNQPMIIAGLWICDQSQVPKGIVRHKEILQYIGDKLNTTSMFRRRLQRAPLGLDDPYWLEDENFDLEYHVRHVGLPQPGDWRQLCIFTARLMSRTMDMERAPWELYIVEGLNNVEGVPEGSFAVILRLHHAYADGKAGVELNMALLEETASHEYGRRDRVEYVQRAPTKVEMWSRTAPRMLSQGYRSFKAGCTVATKSLELYTRLQRESRPDQSRAPHTIFNVPISPHRTYGVLTWKFRDLTAVRKLAEGVTLNDVIVSIIAGGMRRYLQKHDALPDSESLVAMCPVAMRPEAAQKDTGNLVSSMYIAVGTDIEDPLERLELVCQRTRRGVPLARDVVKELSDNALEMMPAYMRQATLWGMGKLRTFSKLSLFNTIITNVPGPVGMQTKHFAGAPLVNAFPLVPIADGVAVSHGISGLYDLVNLGVLADRAVISDMDFYIQCMEDSTREYLQQVQRQKDNNVSQAEIAKTTEAETTA